MPDGRERVIKSRVQAEGIIMLGISGERWHGGSAGGRKEEEKRWKTGLEGQRCRGEVWPRR